MNNRSYYLSDLCDMQQGSYPTMKTLPGNYPLVVTAEYRRTADSYQFDAEAVCIPLVSSTGHGNAALHRIHFQAGKFALANLLVALTPRDPMVCVAKYLYYLLLAQRNQLFVPLMQGTANVSLKIKDIARVQIVLPSVENQTAAVAKIESIAPYIDKAQRLRCAINDDSTALLHSVYHRLAQSAPYHPLAEVAPIIRRPVAIELDGAYPELGARSFGKGTFHKPTLMGSELDWQKLFRVHAGDLVISNIKAWEGAIAVATKADHGRVALHRYITCVAKEGLATPEFLCFYLLTNEGIEQIRGASPGSADRNRTLAMSRLGQIKVPVPAIDKQQDFSALQAKIAAIHQAQAANQSELDALLPAVLDKAFKGEL